MVFLLVDNIKLLNKVGLSHKMRIRLSCYNMMNDFYIH